MRAALPPAHWLSAQAGRERSGGPSTHSVRNCCSPPKLEIPQPMHSSDRGGVPRQELPLLCACDSLDTHSHPNCAGRRWPRRLVGHISRSPPPRCAATAAGDARRRKEDGRGRVGPESDPHTHVDHAHALVPIAFTQLALNPIGYKAGYAASGVGRRVSNMRPGARPSPSPLP